jgi:hypothetical protein
MTVLIDEVQVEPVEPRERPSQPAPPRRQKIDPNEVAALLRRQAERIERLWVD